MIHPPVLLVDVQVVHHLDADAKGVANRAAGQQAKNLVVQGWFFHADLSFQPDRGDAADELFLGEEEDQQGGIIMIRLAAISRFLFGSARVAKLARPIATVNLLLLSR